jgi:flagellar FliL protein
MAKEEAPAEVEVPKKKSKLLIIIIAAVGVIVLVGGGIAAWLLTSAPDKSKKAEHGDEEGAGEEGADGDVHPPVYEKLEPFTVNLADQESYLQTEIQLMVADVKVQEKIKAHMPEVRDAMIRLLSSKTAEELNQPEGKDQLAEEVQQRINEVLAIKKQSKGVKKVLFVAFIIQ